MIDFFISYAREDGEFARALVKRLVELKWDVWIDEKDIPPSVPWMSEIQRAIDESMIVVAVESDDWLSSDACHIEVNLAEQSRVPTIRVAPDIERLDELVSQVVKAHRALPEWRPVALQAAASAAIWDTAGRKRSLLVRGRPLAVMRHVLKERPQDVSEMAAAFVKASAQDSLRRWVTGLALGFVVPVLGLGAWVSIQVAAKAREQVAQNVADSTAFANRSAYADWNTYAGLERAPSDVSDSYVAYYQLFGFLTDRTPAEWDSTPVAEVGPTTATSPDGLVSASADGSYVEVTDATGGTTRLRASAAVTSIAWSPDGRWIAVSTADGADVISAASGQVIPLRGGAGTTTLVQWTDAQHVTVGGSAGTGTWRVFDATPIADLGGIRYGATVGGTLYTVNTAGTVTAVDTTSGETRTIPWDVPAGAPPTAMDATSSQVVVAFAGAEPFLHVIDLGDGSARDLPVPGCSPIALSLTPDGSAAYLACTDAAVNETRVDLTTGAVTSQPMQRQQAYGVRALNDRVLWGGILGGVFESGLDLSPKGILTPSAGCGTPIRKFVGPADGSALFPIGDATGSFACATRIQIHGSVKVNHLIFDASDGHAIPDAATSPDGSLIAYGLSDGRVRVFTVDGFAPVYFAQVLPDQVRAISFTADGKGLVIAGIDGQVVTVPIPFTSFDEGAKALESEALARLKNATSWGIYTSTMEAAPTS